MIRIPLGVAASLLDDELVLLDGASGRYFGLNAAGSMVFTILRETGSPERAVELLCQEYAIDPGRAATDVAALVGQLTSLGLATRDA